MKKYKKVSLLLVFVFTCLLLFSCEFNVGGLTKLKTPVLTLNDNIASWNEIENAVGYELLINEKSEIVYLNVLEKELNPKENMKIRAIGDNIDYTYSDWSNVVVYDPVIPEINMGEKIKAEYEALKKGTTTEHTLWTVTGSVVEMDVKYNSTYDNFNVKAIISVDGVLIGIYNGFVDGSYPKDITGLEQAKELTVTGYIKEEYTLSINNVTAIIEFSNPDIYWDNDSSDDIYTENSVNFVMINDTHGAFLDSDSGVSIGRVDSLFQQLESNSGDHIKILNGDAFQGSFISGQKYGLPLVEALNLMELDCFVLGNHEFDWGLDKIREYADGDLSNGEAEFPFLGANIYYAGTKTSPEWIKPYTIVEYGDKQVGIIGVIGDTQESSILTSYVKDYTFVNPVSIIEQHASYLRTEEECDVVVVATHDYDDWLNSSLASLSGNSLIDGIFCAHTHQLINTNVTRSDGAIIPVVQNYDKNRRATAVSLRFDNGKLSGYSSNVHLPANYPISSRVANLIDKYADLIADSNKVIGVTSNYLNKSTLGTYSTTAMLEYKYNNSEFDNKIDVSIMNTGGVRATIEKGNITKAIVFEVFPFNNKVVLVNISGRLLKSLIRSNEDYLYVNYSNQIGNLNNLSDNTIYQLAVIDYVFEGTYYTEFASLNEDDYVYSDIIMRDILIEYLDNLY